MGLAGPKNKQRLGLDPQNKAWVGDKSKFGYKMLQKMGWSEGTGLGLHGHGQTEHVKVRLKEDTLGVGAEKRSGDNWLENNSGFEELLKKLNSETNSNEGNEGVSSVKVEVEVREVRDVRKVGRLYHRQKLGGVDVDYSSDQCTRLFQNENGGARPEQGEHGCHFVK
ncbi:G-patch domain-containing protein [Gaertneriomyces semiglobifer]|nr:G-patch domain-containing protein [Gaertneriomyces semiglobifer]